MDIDRRNEIMCPVCHCVKQKTQFNTSPIPSLGTELHYCKVCTNKKLKEYIDLLGNEGAALWCLCMEQGLPFVQKAWLASFTEYENNKKQNSLFLLYLAKLKELEDKPTGVWDSDMMLSDFFSEEYTESADLMSERVKVWGKFLKEDGSFDFEAYEYLDRTFEEYTKDLEDIDTNLVRRYRDLAKAELRKRKADESGDIGEMAKAQDNLRKILDMLKLTDFQSKELSDEKRAFEYKTSLVENYRPAECEELNEFLDKVGYEKKKAILMRSIRNAIAETAEYPDIPKEYQ